MKTLAFVLACLWSVAATAAPIVNLKSLSPAGDRAIMTYDKHWVEVDLTRDRAARSFYPPQGCIWTSITYAPDRPDLALAAYCPGPVRNCFQGEAILMVRQGAAPLREVARRSGVRWSGVYWAATDDRAMLIETPIKRPVALGLNDLNKSVQRCGWEAAELKVVDLEKERLIDFDILPPIWPPRAIISADDRVISATVKARRGLDDGSPAAEAIQRICDAPASPQDAMRAVCRSTGYDLVMSWSDGEWRLGAGDWTDGAAFHGRAIATPDQSTLGREDCVLQRTIVRRVDCTLTFSRSGAETVLSAPEGHFGDLALSGDGRVLAAVKAGRSDRNRRFDLWNLETGELQSFTQLLDPLGYFNVWPPSQ